MKTLEVSGSCEVFAKINLYKSKRAVAHPRTLTDKTSSSVRPSVRPSPFVIHCWRVRVGIFIVPPMLTGCALWHAWIWIATEGKGELRQRWWNKRASSAILSFPAEGGRWYPNNGLPTTSPVRPVYKRKKSRRAARQWFSLLVVEKARVSYHRQSAHGIPSELGAWCRGEKKRRDAQVRRRPWMPHKAA